MPGPEVYADAPLWADLQAGVLPPPRGVGDAAPYSGDPKACI